MCRQMHRGRQARVCAAQSSQHPSGAQAHAQLQTAHDYRHHGLRLPAILERSVLGSIPRALAPSCSGFTEQGLALLTGVLVCLWSMLPACQTLDPEPGVCVCDNRCGRQWGQLVLEAAEGELERAVQPLSSMAEPCGESGQHRRLACALFAAGEVS